MIERGYTTTTKNDSVSIQCYPMDENMNLKDDDDDDDDKLIILPL